MGYIIACVCALVNLSFVLKKSTDLSFRVFNSLIVFLLELSVMVGTVIKIFPFLRNAKIWVASSIVNSKYSTGSEGSYFDGNGTFELTKSHHQYG